MSSLCASQGGPCSNTCALTVRQRLGATLPEHAAAAAAARAHALARSSCSLPVVRGPLRDAPCPCLRPARAHRTPRRRACADTHALYASAVRVPSAALTSCSAKTRAATYLPPPRTYLPPWGAVGFVVDGAFEAGVEGPSGSGAFSASRRGLSVHTETHSHECTHRKACTRRQASCLVGGHALQERMVSVMVAEYLPLDTPARELPARELAWVPPAFTASASSSAPSCFALCASISMCRALAAAGGRKSVRKWADIVHRLTRANATPRQEEKGDNPPHELDRDLKFFS